MSDPGEEAARDRLVLARFEQALELPADGLDAFLETLRAEDERLAHRVSEMLRRDAAQSASEVSSALSRVVRAARPEHVEGFRILRELGEGGMGVVYEAEQEHPRRRVALKVLRTAMPSDEVLRRFEYEAEVLACLEHSGIARIHAAGVFELEGAPRPYFAMELVNGHDLRSWAARERPSGERLIELIARVCDAVQHAHSRGVIHRDLKPENVLVDDRGEPKVVDFGVARATDGAAGGRSLMTVAGQVIGTLGYMSPEQLSGSQEVAGSTTDVYSLGVMLYELLAGRLPHLVQGKSVMAVVREVCGEPPPPLGRFAPRYRGDLETIVAKALEWEVARRYASAGELAADLRRFLHHRPIEARPASRAHRLRMFVRRNRALVSLGVAAAAVAVVGVVATVQARLRADEKARTAEAINRYLLRDMIEAANPWQLGRDVRVVDVLERAVPRIEEAFADDPAVEAALRHSVGGTYIGLGLWQEAEAQLVAAEAGLRERGGPDDPSRLDALFDLAAVNANLARFDSALVGMAEVHERWSESLGADHPRTIEARGDLAILLFESGRVAEAEAAGRAALAAAEAALPVDHLERWNATRKLGTILSFLDEHEEGERLLRAYSDHMRAIHAPEHPAVLGSTLALAFCLQGKGELQVAAGLMRDVLVQCEATLGSTHPMTRRATSALANTKEQLGEWDEALELHHAAVDSFTEALGSDHMHTLVVRRNLARFLLSTGRLEEAAEELRWVLEDWELRESEPSLGEAFAIEAWSDLLSARGEHQAAMEVGQRAVRMAFEAAGPDDPRARGILDGQLERLIGRGETVRALELAREILGHGHPATAELEQRLEAR